MSERRKPRYFVLLRHDPVAEGECNKEHIREVCDSKREASAAATRAMAMGRVRVIVGREMTIETPAVVKLS